GRVTRFVPVPGRDWVLATTDAAGDVLFDPATGKVVAGWRDPRPGDPTVAAPSPDGTLIAFGSPLTPVKLWNARTQKADRPAAGQAARPGSHAGPPPAVWSATTTSRGTRPRGATPEAAPPVRSPAPPARAPEMESAGSVQDQLPSRTTRPARAVTRGRPLPPR